MGAAEGSSAAAFHAGGPALHQTEALAAQDRAPLEAMTVAAAAMARVTTVCRSPSLRPAQLELGFVARAPRRLPPPTLLLWVRRYLTEMVIGIQADNTVEAKSRDLRVFCEFFARATGALVIGRWRRQHTCAWLRALEDEGKAPATVNRMFRSVRHFARWVHAQPGTPFAIVGQPTAGIRELVIDEPPAKKLSSDEIRRLFEAADHLVATDTRANTRPHRNRAMLAVLYLTGLRVGELLSLRLDQYDGRAFRNVRRKGRVRTPELYLPSRGRVLLESYLEHERPVDAARGLAELGGAWLFLRASGDRAVPMSRGSVRSALARIGRVADAHAVDAAPIEIYPHRLRHTFGYAVRALTKSDSETARLLGHQSNRYAGRYARSTQAEREALLECLPLGSPPPGSLPLGTPPLGTNTTTPPQPS